MKFTHQLSPQQFTQTFEFLSERSYWSQGISRERLEKAFAHSLCFALIENKQLLAFARVVTDQATFANLLDVFVLEPFRGQGLGKKLMDHVMSHPELPKGSPKIIIKFQLHHSHPYFSNRFALLPVRN
ncbi:GNAT family N-acetyltransferase, partial [Pseudoalteromonas rhizosphaerae]